MMIYENGEIVNIAHLFFFGIIRYGICNIYFKLISLNSQMMILYNDIKHYVAEKLKNLC